MRLKEIVPMNWKIAAYRLFKRRGVVSFIVSLGRDPKLLDIGCGNDSPLKYKRIRPDIYYIGLDVGNYKQSNYSATIADQYILVSSDKFSQTIEKYDGKIDTVISAHNLEHCNMPDEVLRAMVKALKPGGRIYLSFPCQDSIKFPSRRGTLNFYDDKTHRIIPKFNDVCFFLKSQGMEIDYASQRYRPSLLFTIGLILEPFSRLFNRMAPFGATWAFYGFETVIWATRR